MTLFWRRVGITAAAAIAVAGVAPGTAQADSFVHYTCEYVSPVFDNPLGSSFALANGCAGPEGSHQHVFFDGTQPVSASMCLRGSAFPVSDGTLHVTGWDCV
jgi:hypothetical protein